MPSKPSRFALPLASIFAALCALASPCALAAQAHAREVEHVRLQGVHALPTNLIKASLETQATHCKSLLLEPLCALGISWALQRHYLDMATVVRDTGTIRRLYAEWGYPDATATAQVLEHGEHKATVVFHVHEGVPTLVRSLRVEGLEGTGVSTAGLPLRVGRPYATTLLNASERLLLARLGDKGRPFGSVEVTGKVSAATHEADVVLHVTPGPVAVFGTTTVNVRPPLAQSVVRKRIAWRAGQRFNPGALARTRQLLYDLPIMDTALVVPSRGPDSTVDVTVTAIPGRVSAIQGSGSISSTACISGQAYWSDRYFAGRPRVVSLGAGASNLLVSNLRGFPCNSAGTGPFAEPDYFGRLDWREPVGPATWLLISGDYSRLTAPGAYIQRGAEGRIALQRSIRPGLDVTPSYAPSRLASTAAGAFFCALYGGCSASAVSALQAPRYIAPLGLDVTWQPPSHARGTMGPAPGLLSALAAPRPLWLYAARGSLAGAAAPTLSSRHYTRADVYGTLTRLLGRRFELAGRLRLAGLAGFGDSIPPQFRVFGGGPYGVRGAPQNMLGPKFLVADSAQAAALPCGPAPGSCAGVTITPDQVLVRATGGGFVLESGLEGRIWVSQAVQLAAFLDYGFVQSGALSGSPSSASASRGLLSPGIGIRLITPVGPIRLDFAYDPTTRVSYPLLAQQPDGSYVNLGLVSFEPYKNMGGPFVVFRRHIQVQFSMGQPF